MSDKVKGTQGIAGVIMEKGPTLTEESSSDVLGMGDGESRESEGDTNRAHRKERAKRLERTSFKGRVRE